MQEYLENIKYARRLRIQRMQSALQPPPQIDSSNISFREANVVPVDEIYPMGPALTEQQSESEPEVFTNEDVYPVRQYDCYESVYLNEVQKLKYQIDSTAAQYIPEYNPRFRLEDINMEDLVVEYPVMTLKVQKYYKSATRPPPMYNRLAYETGKFTNTLTQSPFEAETLRPPQNPPRERKTVYFNEQDLNGDTIVSQKNIFYYKFDMSKKNPFLAYYLGHAGVPAKTKLPTPYNEYDLNNSRSLPLEYVSRQFPMQHYYQSQLKFGKMPIAEATNIASNMFTVNSANPSEERQSALLRIRQTSRGQKYGALYQDPKSRQMYEYNTLPQSTIGYYKSTQYAGVNEIPTELLYVTQPQHIPVNEAIGTYCQPPLTDEQKLAQRHYLLYKIKKSAFSQNATTTCFSVGNTDRQTIETDLCSVAPIYIYDIDYQRFPKIFCYLMKGELQLAKPVYMNRVVEPSVYHSDSESSNDVVVFQAAKQYTFEKGTKLTEEEIAYKQSLAKMNISAVQNYVGIKIYPSAEQRKYFKIHYLPSCDFSLQGKAAPRKSEFGLIGMTEQQINSYAMGLLSEKW